MPTPTQNCYISLPTAASQSVAWPAVDATYTRQVTFDCSKWLAFVFASSIASITLTSASGGITVSNPVANGTLFTFAQSGGTHDTANNVVVMQLTTDTGRKEVLTFNIPISNSYPRNPLIYGNVGHAQYTAPPATGGGASNAQLQAEADARTAADAANATAIAKETSDRLGAIQAEADARTAAITANATIDAAEKAARIQAISDEVAARTQAITDEVTARTAAITAAVGVEAAQRNTAIVGEQTARDAAVAAAIGTEVTNRNTAIGNAVSTEAALRSTADQTEHDARVAADTAEATARAAADAAALLAEQNDIANEIVARNLAISNASAQIATDRATAIAAAISGEVTARNTAITSAVNTAVGAEATARDTAIGAAVNGEVTARNTAISNAVASEASARDSAISAAISANNGTGDGALATKKYVNDGIAAEVTSRNSAIASNIGTEVTNRNTAINNAISQEVMDRGTAISGAISAEVTNRNKAISDSATAVTGSITSAITQEVSDRNAAIGAAINGEVTARNTAIGNAVSTEASARDTAIGNAIGGEVTARNNAISSAVTTLNTNITNAVAAEATARDQAISTATGNTIGQEVTNRNTAISNAIASEVTSRNTAISSAVSAEATARDTAIGNAISTEVTNRNNAIGTEATARDAAISTAINNEVTARNTAISNATSTNSKRFGYISLSDYSPKADGTDDSTAFLAAYNAARSLSQANGNALVDVRVQPGSYGLATPIAMNDNTGNGINVRFLGIGKPKIKAIGTTGGLFTIRGLRGVVESLTLDGNLAAHTSDFTPIVQIGDGGTTLTSGSGVRQCDILNPTNGVVANSADSLVVDGNTVTGSNLHSIYLNACFDCRVTNNKLNGGTAFGVLLINGSYRNLIQGNSTSQNGLELVGVTQDCYENRIVDNHAEGTGDNGISVTGYKNAILGNIVKGCQGNGIQLFGERNLVVGNTLINNAKGNANQAGWRAGIMLAGGFGGTPQFNTVTGNIIDDEQATPTQLYGVMMQPSGYTAWAAGQTISGATATSPVYRYVGANLYKTTTNGTTGSTSLTHTSGSASDGNLSWAFVRTAPAGSFGAFANEISSNNVIRAPSGKYQDNSGGIGGNVNEISASFQPAVSGPANNLAIPGGITGVQISNPTAYQVSAGTPLAIAVSAPDNTGGTQAAVAVTTYSLLGFGTIAAGGTGYAVGDILNITGGQPNGTVTSIKVTAVSNGAVTGFTSNGGTFSYSTLPPLTGGNSAYTASTGSGSGFQTTPIQFRAGTLAVTAGTGYVKVPTFTVTGATSGQPTLTAVLNTSFTLPVGAGQIAFDQQGTHLGVTGAYGSPVINEGARIDGSGTSITPTEGGTFTIANNSSLVRLRNTGGLSAVTLNLPTTLRDGQELEIVSVNNAGTILGLTFSPAVTGFANGTSLPGGSKLRLVYDPTANSWVHTGAPFVPAISYQNFKNFLHNYSFQFNWRALTSVTANNVFVADRWVHLDAGGGGSSATRTLTIVQLSDLDRSIAGDESLVNGIRIQTTNGGTATSDFEILAQYMEDVRRFAGQQVCVSFWAKAAASGQKLSLEIAQQYGSGGSPSALTSSPLGVFTLTTTLKRYFAVVTLPTAQGKTFGTTANTDNVMLNFYTSAGANFNARASNLGLVTSSDITIVGPQIELGNVPTTLERRDREVDYNMCRRFFQFAGYNSSQGEVVLYGGGNGYLAPYTIPFNPPMRATPNISGGLTSQGSTTGTFTTKAYADRFVININATGAGALYFSYGFTATAEFTGT